jgi:hypothetical protein
MVIKMRVSLYKICGKCDKLNAMWQDGTNIHAEVFHYIETQTKISLHNILSPA